MMNPTSILKIAGILMMIAAAFAIGRQSAECPVEVSCMNWINQTHYKNYCEGSTIPSQCQPTGGCFDSKACNGSEACGYLCTGAVCSEFKGFCGRAQFDLSNFTVEQG